MVKRYEEEYGGVGERSDGIFVKYEDYAKLQKERDALAVENLGMDGFVDALLSIAWQGGSADGADIQNLALKHGLIRQDSYVADIHENIVEDPGNFEDGDEVYLRIEIPATDAFLNAVRAEGVDLAVNELKSLAKRSMDEAPHAAEHSHADALYLMLLAAKLRAQKGDSDAE